MMIIIFNVYLLLAEINFDRADVNQSVAELRLKLSSRPNRNVQSLIADMSRKWMVILSPQILSDKFQSLADFVAAERGKGTPIYPPADKVGCAPWWLNEEEENL